jgi:TonB family protein
MSRFAFAVALLSLALAQSVVSAQVNASYQKPTPLGLFGSGFVPGSGTYSPNIANAIRDKWQANVKAKPHSDWSGTTIIECAVKRDGSLKKVRIERSSGNKSVDEAAKSAAESAGPFTKLPENFKGTKFRVFFYYNLPSTDERPACSSLHLPEYPKVGGSIRPPRAVYMPDPEYSEEARQADYQGSVVLNLTVAPDGTVKEVCLDRVLGLGLDEKAVAAVRSWKFEAATENGVPVAVRTSAETEFRLY